MTTKPHRSPDQSQAIQLIPGGGWTATYRQATGEEITSPLIAWALLANGDVEPLDTDSTGMIDNPTRADNFIRLNPPGAEQ